MKNILMTGILTGSLALGGCSTIQPKIPQENPEDTAERSFNMAKAFHETKEALGMSMDDDLPSAILLSRRLQSAIQSGTAQILCADEHNKEASGLIIESEGKIYSINHVQGWAFEIKKSTEVFQSIKDPLDAKKVIRILNC